VLAAHELTRSRMIARTQLKFEPFKKEQKVWIDSRNLSTKYNKKISPKREGPFKIKDVLGLLIYRLKIPKTWKQIHNVFHATLLRPYVENDIYGPNYPRPPAELVDGEEEFEVEQILGHRKNCGKLKYLVLWKGYLITKVLWEPESQFTHAEDMLTQYERLHKL